jgi:copper/silver efflux system protein
LKISGDNLRTISDLGVKAESILSRVKGTRAVFAERTGNGYFLDFNWDRDELARYGLSIDEAQNVIQSAIGGENVTTTIEGRKRFPVNVRYMRDFRSDLDALNRVLVPVQGGQRQIALKQLADVTIESGPAMIRDENGLLTGYVYVDIAGRDPNGYVQEASQVLRDKLSLPVGYAVSWSGQYEAVARMQKRLTIVVPLTLFLIILLLYLNTRSITKTVIVLMAVPFSAIGAIWFVYLLGYNMSIGVWVGLIALFGVDAETGVFMLLYLELAHAEALEQNRLNSLADLHDAIRQGAAKRLRPKFMTFATTCLGLIPIMWATGAGADVMKRIAAPMIGGIFTSFALELVVYPVVYEVWRWHFGMKKTCVASATIEKIPFVTTAA